MKNHGDDRTKHQWCQAGKAASKSGEENEVFEKNAESGFCCLLLLVMLKPRNIGLFLILTSGEELDLGTIRIGTLMILGEIL